MSKPHQPQKSDGQRLHATIVPRDIALDFIGVDLSPDVDHNEDMDSEEGHLPTISDKDDLTTAVKKRELSNNLALPLSELDEPWTAEASDLVHNQHTNQCKNFNDSAEE